MADYRAAQERMKHVPKPAHPAAPLPVGTPDAGYPLNEQGDVDFNVGGVERYLPPAQQLEQLVSYMDATYPRPDVTPPWHGGHGDSAEADRYSAHLADRITHASMLMLGSGLDHTMPGVAYGMNVDAREIPGLNATLLTPTEPTDRWAVSLHPGGWWRGSGVARQLHHQPEAAAVAELSGTTILDVDYPLAPAHDVAAMTSHVKQALEYVAEQAPSSVALWGVGSGGELAALCTRLAAVDALVLTYPSYGTLAGLPDELRGAHTVPAPGTWPRTLLQVARADEVVDYPRDACADEYALAPQITVAEYCSTHWMATPEVSRQRVRDAAEFLHSL